MTKRIVIIAGPNAAGNTMFARNFLPQETDCPDFINADLIAAGLSPFRPKTIDECGSATDGTLHYGYRAMRLQSRLAGKQFDFVEYFKWPNGFLGYDSWWAWLSGNLLSSRRQIFQADPLSYDCLNVFWKVAAQVMIIRPFQAKLAVAFVLTFCGSKRWVYVMYGKRAYQYYLLDGKLDTVSGVLPQTMG